MWRPKDWDTIKDNLDGERFNIYSAFELGADAMLDALRRQSGVFTFDKIVQFPIREDGKWIFIPNEST
jgi:hypothetical protein